MDIKHLRLVKYIVELGSMAKSKDKLCLTQSALSHQLKEAEILAGTALFHRCNKKLVLTAAGEMVYKTATDVLEKIDKLDNEIRFISQGDKGIIRLCTACFTNYYWLPALIARFSELHPNVEIKIYPEFINECIPRLQNHDLDAVIMTKPEPIKGIRFHEIMNDELIAIVPPNHEWTLKKYVKAADFEGRNLIIFSKPLNSVVVYNKLLKPAGIIPKFIYEVPMTEAMVEMVISGMGVAVIPYWIALPYIESGKVCRVRVTQKGLHRCLGIAFHERDNYPAYFDTLIDFLKENLDKKVI
jgi:LysR family transcriptional regulator, regulator for metE and metH